MSEQESKKIGRRDMLKRAALVAAGLAAIPEVARAAGTVAKAAMQYQDRPKNGQDCSTCLQFIPGKSPTSMGECKVVAGPISPKGWCIAYVKNS